MSWKRNHSKLRDRVFKASGAKTHRGFDERVARMAKEKSITTEEALFLLANKYGVGVANDLKKLSDDSRQRVSHIVNTTFSNTTNHTRVDKQVWQFTNSPVGNLNTGHRSIVNQNNNQGVLGSELIVLLELVKNNTEISSTDKEDLQLDIQTIAAQVSKNKKDKGIISAAWKNLSRLADIEGCADAFARITLLIQSLLA